MPIPQWRNSGVRGKTHSHISLLFDVVLTSPSFWISPYSDYQEFLFQTISDLRHNENTFHQISEWLIEKGYLTPRGKTFSERHVFSILKKGRIRDERVFRGAEITLKNTNLKRYKIGDNSNAL